MCLEPTGSHDQTARIWDARTGALLTVLTGFGGGVEVLAFSPDGALLATGGEDRSVRVWDTQAR